MRVAVFGYDELVLASTHAVARAGGRIAAVVFPSTRSGPHVDRIRSLIAEQGHPILEQPLRSRIDSFVHLLRQARPDVILVWSYPMILPPPILELPPLGCINIHAGLLPAYRGANGIQWALINGEPRTGVTLHYMDAGIDTGPMIARAAFPIKDEDDIVSLMQKSRTAGIMLLEQFWPQIVAGTAPRMPQEENQARYYPPRTREMNRIDWSQSAAATHNLVRALAPPFAGAFTSWRGQNVVIRRARPLNDETAGCPPGEIYATDEASLRVAAGDGALLVEEIEVEDTETASPATPTIGDRFE